MKIDDRTVEWLRSIGIPVRFGSPDPAECFVPGVWLDHGFLVVNPERAHVGDVLHEAGHLACVPACMRELIEPGSLPTPKLLAAIDRYLDSHSFTDEQGREDPVIRAIMQMGDCEATAWAYAASKVLGLSPAILFSKREFGGVPYDGSGPEIWGMLDANAYMGINGLQAAGFCTVREFPTMRRWLSP